MPPLVPLFTMEFDLVVYEQDHKSATDDHQNDETNLTDSLPSGHSWGLSSNLHRYKGFWYYPVLLRGTLQVQTRFTPRPDDVIICSHPKTGTTWLKALCFAILTRHRFDATTPRDHPLLSVLPHDCVPFLEVDFAGSNGENATCLKPEIPLVSTHVPYSALPRSIEEHGNRIVYICRDPKDVFISLWHFVGKVLGKGSDPPPLEEAFDLFCKGISLYGPYWDHVTEYWEASGRNRDRIMFMRYEDLKSDQVSEVKRLGCFLGRPFSSEEEGEGAVEGIVELCSFESLSNLEVNKNGKHRRDTSLAPTENNAYFRKGQVGDWKNYLDPQMARRIDTITHEKFSGLGLTSSSDV